jgi:hypothetical protein
MTHVGGADLVDALHLEARLLTELRKSLAQQRAGVAECDADLLDASTRAVSRTVLTLEEARRRRARLSQLIAAGEADADEAPREPLDPPGFAKARVDLRQIAADTIRELSLNQVILKRAIRAGDACLQEMFGSGQPSAGYAADSRPMDRHVAGGVVVNRRA